MFLRCKADSTFSATCFMVVQLQLVHCELQNGLLSLAGLQWAEGGYQSTTLHHISVERRGAAVARATCRRIIAGSSCRLCCAVHGLVLLGKSLHPHVHSLDPGVNWVPDIYFYRYDH